MEDVLIGAGRFALPQRTARFAEAEGKRQVVVVGATETPVKQRPLGIATIRDRVVQTAGKRVLELIIEPHLHPDSYGYRPGRRAQDAVNEIEASLRAGYRTGTMPT